MNIEFNPTIRTVDSFEPTELNSFEDVDYDNTLSFTLPIQVPTNGGGLNTWEDESMKQYEIDNNYIYESDIHSLAIFVEQLRRFGEIQYGRQRKLEEYKLPKRTVVG